MQHAGGFDGKQVGFALVGLGNLAIDQLLPAFARCRQAKLMGFVSGRPRAARCGAARVDV
jgi:hypothetical protein